MPKHYVVIPAAGVGQRMGASHDGQPLAKQYLQLHGKTLLEHSVTAFLRHADIDLVVVVVAPGDQLSTTVLEDLSCARLKVLDKGGVSRQSSVLNGLKWLSELVLSKLGPEEPAPWVLVHDAARPGLQQETLQRLLDSVHEGGAAGLSGGILALPVVDSLKRAHAGSNLVQDSPSRQDIWVAQTPQMFRLTELSAALQHCEVSQIAVTDEASAIETMGGSVALILGERVNLKITIPEDLQWLEAIWTQ